MKNLCSVNKHGLCPELLLLHGYLEQLSCYQNRFKCRKAGENGVNLKRYSGILFWQVHNQVLRIKATS